MNKILGLFTLVGLSLAVPASAEPANLLGVFGNWSAYSSGTGASLTCYALSKPRASSPKTAKRSAIYLMISDWPARKVKAEPQVVYGYQAKEGAVAGLGVGPDKFSFFIRNSGKDGSAWLQQLNDNPRLIGAMQGGVSAVASGVSSKGTKTSDTYSLSGFNDALSKIHAVCQM
ncbi:MAG TPA: invasion associated locus B family protein [Rhizomicrobium sp.]|nr:invasion associated locus B family protein [Rhizomicrobium sp.]